MNRRQRRYIEKELRKKGMRKNDIKNFVNENFMGAKYKPGDKCKFNYELIKRHPQFKRQIEDFQSWVHAHATDVLTIDKVRNQGREVTFVEDTQANQYWHTSTTLLPVTEFEDKIDSFIISNTQME